MIITSEYNTVYFSLDIPNLSSMPFGETLIIKQIKKIDLSFGADNIDNESIFFPSSLKLEFWTNHPSMLLALYDSNVKITVYENDQVVFIGYIDIEDINFDRQDNTYRLTFIDKSEKLKKIDYSYLGQFIGNQNVDYVTTLIDAIASVVDSTVNYYGIDNLQGKTAFYDGVDYYVCSYLKFGTSPEYFFQGLYATLWDVLKAILDSFGLIGYFSGGTFNVYPRFFSSPILVDNNLLRNQEITVIANYDYIIAQIRIDNLSGAVEKIYDHRVLVNKDPVKPVTYKFEVAGGDHPTYNNQISFTNLYGYVDEYIAGLGNGHWSLINNGVRVNGGSFYPCWEAVARAIRDIITLPRLKVRAELYGLDIKLFDTIQIAGKNYKVINTKRSLGTNKISIIGLS
ncbi:MAG: hypothetical protein Fur0015_04400 [Ignavibacteriales bacterium]